MKKLLCPLFALLIVLSLSTAAFAANYSAEESANALYELGLFQGTGETANGKPIYSLDAAPTRAQAVTMLVRLLGKEAEAKAGTWTLPFSDLADWARPYVGYAYANGLTNGLSAERFGSDDKVTANQYLTFILRAGLLLGERLPVGQGQRLQRLSWSDARGIPCIAQFHARRHRAHLLCRARAGAQGQQRNAGRAARAAGRGEGKNRGGVRAGPCSGQRGLFEHCRKPLYPAKRGRQISGRLRRCADAVGQAIYLVCLARRG